MEFWYPTGVQYTFSSCHQQLNLLIYSCLVAGGTVCMITLSMHSVSAGQSMIPQFRAFMPLFGILALRKEFTGIYTGEALETYQCTDFQAALEVR